MARALGKHPPVNDPRVPALRALMAEHAVPPDECNWYADVGAWPVLANDHIGDCVPAAALHAIQQRRAYAGNPVALTDDDALRLYSTWANYDPTRPETDRGTVMSAAMAAWASTGVSIGDEVDQLLAYAQVEHVSVSWLKAAIWHCGSVLLGIRCPASWMQADYLLDLPNGAGDIAGGHAVLLCGYVPTALGVEFDTITWGARFRMTERALSLVADEAFAVLDQDFFDARGINPAGVDWATAQAAVAALRA